MNIFHILKTAENEIKNLQLLTLSQ